MNVKSITERNLEHLQYFEIKQCYQITEYEEIKRNIREHFEINKNEDAAYFNYIE